MTSDNDMDAANDTYSGFLSFLKIGTILAAIATIFAIILIT